MSFGVIACHDGSLIRYNTDNDTVAGENTRSVDALDTKLKRLSSSCNNRGKTEAETLSLMESEVGVRIERIISS